MSIKELQYTIYQAENSIGFLTRIQVDAMVAAAEAIGDKDEDVVDYLRRYTEFPNRNTRADLMQAVLAFDADHNSKYH